MAISLGIYPIFRHTRRDFTRVAGYELQKLREIFESVDANGDGAISKKDCGGKSAHEKPAWGCNLTPSLKMAFILYKLNKVIEWGTYIKK